MSSVFQHAVWQIRVKIYLRDKLNKLNSTSTKQYSLNLFPVVRSLTKLETEQSCLVLEYTIKQWSQNYSNSQTFETNLEKVSTVSCSHFATWNRAIEGQVDQHCTNVSLPKKILNKMTLQFYGSIPTQGSSLTLLLLHSFLFAYMLIHL
jgi:Ca2+-dependent lipid-binding protein